MSLNLLPKKVTVVQKVRLCLLLNISLLTIVSLFISIFASNSQYFRFGPNPDFVIISVEIYNYYRYIILLTMITCINIIKVIIQEIGEPILVFNIYNPDKKVITEFTNCELQLYGNMMFFVSNLRRVFEIMVTVTQIDIALYSVFIEQLTSIVTVSFLVNEKKFELEKDVNSDDDNIDNCNLLSE